MDFNINTTGKLLFLNAKKYVIVAILILIKALLVGLIATFFTAAIYLMYLGIDWSIRTMIDNLFTVPFFILFGILFVLLWKEIEI